MTVMVIRSRLSSDTTSSVPCWRASWGNRQAPLSMPRKMFLIAWDVASANRVIRSSGPTWNVLM